MRAEHFDLARRQLLQIRAELVTAADPDPDAPERVEAGLVAVLDELLMRLREYSAQRGGAATSAAAEFCLLACRPAWLHYHGAALLDERSALRWKAAIDARAKAGRQAADINLPAGLASLCWPGASQPTSTIRAARAVLARLRRSRNNARRSAGTW